MSKILTVFGATGNQGGSVIKSVLADSTLSSQFKIRAVTRDVTKPGAKALEAQGVEVVSADLSKPETLAFVVNGAHTVFLSTNYWEYMSADVELTQGKAVTDACKAAGVEHLIYSSLIHTREASQGRLTEIFHFDAKADVEKYIRQSGLNATFFLPGMFMNSFLDFIQKNEDGSYVWAAPITSDAKVIPLIDAAVDTGKWVKIAIKKYPQYVGKQIYAANDYASPNQLMADFSEGVGKPASYQQIPGEVWKTFLPAPIAQEMLENMLLLEDCGYFAGADLKESLAMLEEKPTVWKEYVKANKA